jgi:prepilin-type N-terminal cleavage/methylation domain-containing protein
MNGAETLHLPTAGMGRCSAGPSTCRMAPSVLRLRLPGFSMLQSASAFTLLELLVVLGIIGLLAALGLPALKGISQANTLAAANRQMQDDLAYARARAIHGRTTVYMVFVPPNLPADFNRILAQLNPAQRNQLTNLLGGQFTAYALISKRSIGDQPGQHRARYLTGWRHLPDGVFIPPTKYLSQIKIPSLNLTIPRFNKLSDPLPFPSTQSPFLATDLPGLAFNSLGQLAQATNDTIIPLARGSILYPKNAQGKYVPLSPDLQETPPGNATNTYNLIRINWLTGRARIVKRELQ